MFIMDHAKQFFYVKIKYKNNFIPPLPSFLDPCNWKQRIFLGLRVDSDRMRCVFSLRIIASKITHA